MRKIFYLVTALSVFTSCDKKQVEDYYWLKNSIDIASSQLLLTANEIGESGKLPRTIYTGYTMDFLCRQLERDSVTFKDSLRANPTAEELGTRRYCPDVYDWTSGFFPGSLWYAYEISKKPELKEKAVKFTTLLNPVRNFTGNHDIGFMINCSYGNAKRLSPNDTINSVIIDAAESLISRFDESVGCIRSWDFGTWNYPVIIDNMMNLDLLFNATKISSNPKYKEIAIKHADKTMANHFRDDFTSWHVISYNNDGTVECKQTFQGKNDDSSWARGQAWGVYGYASCYRETKNPAYLKFAINIAEMIMERVNTSDYIPYWDYDAPVADDTPRDASAAAVTASAFFELSTLTDNGQKYFDYAEKILKNLSGSYYLAKKGENEGFVLMHSTGSLPHGSEIDTPLNYADYYYLESIQKYMNLKNLSYEEL